MNIQVPGLEIVPDMGKVQELEETMFGFLYY